MTQFDLNMPHSKTETAPEAQQKSDETVEERGSVKHQPGIPFRKDLQRPYRASTPRPCYFLSPSSSLFPMIAASFTKEGKPLKLALV